MGTLPLSLLSFGSMPFGTKEVERCAVQPFNSADAQYASDDAGHTPRLGALRLRGAARRVWYARAVSAQCTNDSGCVCRYCSNGISPGGRCGPQIAAQ